MVRVGGSPSPYAPLLTVNLPYNQIQGKSSAEAGIWTIATGGSIDHTDVVSPAFDLSLHSIVAKVYGVAGTGSLTLYVNNIGINTNMGPQTIAANTLAPQVFRYKRGALTIKKGVFGAFAGFSSSAWVQGSGGVFININAYL